MQAVLPDGCASASQIDVLRKRSRPRIVLLYEDLTIAFFEPEAARILEMRLVPFAHLPPNLEACVRNLVRAASAGEDDPIALPLPGVVFRVQRLLGTATLVAVFVERHAQREDLTDAAKRYGLTRRQIEVLSLFLRGLSAGEIAEQLCVAQCTVSDHFKVLLAKTGARSRAEMAAKMLGWAE